MCTALHRAGVSLTQAGRLTWILCPGRQVFEILLSRGYSENNFREDLKNLYLKLGIENKRMIFLFTDAHVAEEGFLELINNMLTSGTTGLAVQGPGGLSGLQMGGGAAARKWEEPMWGGVSWRGRTSQGLWVP